MTLPRVLGIDPGTVQTAWALWDGTKVLECAIVPNLEMLDLVRNGHWQEAPTYIEMIASYGMPVGKEIFETVLWIGRFVEVMDIREQPCKLVYRREVKMHHCHSAQAKDSNVAQALKDKYGVVGTKKAPGPLYGVKKDIWSALAIASYGLEKFGSIQT